MTTRDSAYTNSDDEYQEICDFLDRLAAQDPFAHWESGRMGYWRHSLHAAEAPRGAFFGENAHVWRDDHGSIVALCISEYGKNDLFIEVSPAYREIYSDIFRWIDEVWAAERTEVEIDVFCEDTDKIRRLEENGYRFLRHFENKRTYELEGVPLDYELEAGFTIRTFSEHPDMAGRVALVQSAFDNPDYTEARLTGLMSSPDYRDEYNLMVISPSGLPVAYCVGWHERARVGHGFVEPVGTHADFRRRGFAQAVIRECFARLKASGMYTVEIASRAEPAAANFLYDSLMPSSKREVHKYGKATSAAQPGHREEKTG